MSLSRSVGRRRDDRASGDAELGRTNSTCDGATRPKLGSDSIFVPATLLWLGRVSGLFGNPLDRAADAVGYIHGVSAGQLLAG